MSYNVVFLYIKDFWLNSIFETLDDKKNNQRMDQKIKRRFQVSQFLSENSNSLIVGTSIKFWWKNPFAHKGTVQCTIPLLIKELFIVQSFCS